MRPAPARNRWGGAGHPTETTKPTNNSSESLLRRTIAKHGVHDAGSPDPPRTLAAPAKECFVQVPAAPSHAPGLRLLLLSSLGGRLMWRPRPTVPPVVIGSVCKSLPTSSVYKSYVRNYQVRFVFCPTSRPNAHRTNRIHEPPLYDQFRSRSWRYWPTPRSSEGGLRQHPRIAIPDPVTQRMVRARTPIRRIKSVSNEANRLRRHVLDLYRHVHCIRAVARSPSSLLRFFAKPHTHDPHRLIRRRDYRHRVVGLHTDGVRPTGVWCSRRC